MSVNADANPPPREDAAGSRVALVVAVDTYLDEGLRRLRAPATDAATFGAMLGDPDLGGFDVTSLVNGTGHQVRLAIAEFLSDCRPEDIALVYLSCHGLMDVRRRLYFAAGDTLKDRLSATGIEAHWLLDQLEECRARRQVVVLDCCFSGAFARGAKGETELGLGERLLGEGRGRVVLTASRGTEYSFEGSPVPGSAVPGSVFTQALVAGIRTGAADTDRDGYISVDDAYTYAFDELRTAGAEQTPQRWLYGAEGSILLSRNPIGTATPLVRPSGSSPRRELPTTSRSSGLRALVSRHRAAAAAVTVGVAVVAGVVAWGGLHDAGADPTGGSTSGTPKSWEIDRRGPWNLQIDALEIPSGRPGCQVTLKNTDTGETTSYPDSEAGPELESSLWQIAQVGHFRVTVNDDDCAVLKRTRPYRVDTGSFSTATTFFHGDSPAFATDGPVDVEVTDFQDTPTCRLYLRSVATGESVAVAQASSDSSDTRHVALNPSGAREAYIADPPCMITVTP